VKLSIIIAAFAFLTGWSLVAPGVLTPGTLTRWQIIETIEKESLYSLSASAIVALENCMFVEINDMLDKCFPQDRYSIYRSVDEHRALLQAKKEKPYEAYVFSGIGYLKLGRISDAEDIRLVREVSAGLRKMNAEGVRKLVLDESDNPGGSVLVALDFLKLFSPGPEEIIISERSRGGEIQTGRVWKTEQKGAHSDMRIAVIVNRNTASAAELIAGVLQQWGHPIVGERTVGKSEILNTYSIPNGGFITLTVRRYYFSDGSTISRGAGISPNISIKGLTTRERRNRSFVAAYEHLRKLN